MVATTHAEPDFNRRFGGIGRLYGEAAQQRLATAHCCVIGIGGVGSWAAEALARTGVGELTLIDLDNVAESNVNRQVHAISGEFGKPKVQAMAERIALIHPECRVNLIEDFVEADNLERYLAPRYDFVLDAIDSVRAKVALIAWCQRQKQPLIVSGAAGGQIDPTKICIDDLSRTTQDPIAAKLRAQLRKHHGFPRDLKKKFGVPCVYSTEVLRYPTQSCATTTASGLNCAGFGSSMMVTASFGMAAAAYAVAQLAASAAR